MVANFSTPPESCTNKYLLQFTLHRRLHRPHHRSNNQDELSHKHRPHHK